MLRIASPTVHGGADQRAMEPTLQDPVALIDFSLLKIAAPQTSLTTLAGFVVPLRMACRRFEIDTVREVACLLSQGAHESNGFQTLEENLHYGAQRLVEVWPKRFPNLAVALPYANNPEKLANKVYAERMGNGDEASGDGWRYRGAGIFQLTGKNNHQACARDVGVALADFPNYIRTPEGAAMSAGWYFHENGLDKVAATPGVEDDTQAVNGGQLGLADRKQKFDAIVAELLRRGA